jgi:hypothetical protein
VLVVGSARVSEEALHLRSDPFLSGLVGWVTDHSHVDVSGFPVQTGAARVSEEALHLQPDLSCGSLTAFSRGLVPRDVGSYVYPNRFWLAVGSARVAEEAFDIRPDLAEPEDHVL